MADESSKNEDSTHKNSPNEDSPEAEGADVEQVGGWDALRKDGEKPVDSASVDAVAEAVAQHPALQREPRLLTPSAQWSHYSRYVYLLSKLLFFGIIMGIGVYLTQSLAAVLFPIFVSLLIAYLLDPGIDWLEERKVNRTVGILLFISLGLVGIAGMVLFLYPTIARLVVSLVRKAPQLFDLIQEEQIPWFEKTFRIDIPPTFREAIAKYGEQLEKAMPVIAQKAGSWATEIVTQTGAIMMSLVNLVMIPVFSFYFLRDFDVVKRHATELLPAYRRDFLLNRFEKMDAVVGQWFRGQIQVAGILGVLYSIGLTAVFASVGIEWTSGLAVGVVVGILNIVPYFGVLMGIILAGLIVLIEWSGIGAVIGVGVVFFVVQMLEGYIITPKIVGEKVGLSPVVVIIVLLLGGELGGLLGILLAIPVAGALKVLLPDLIEYYQTTPFYTGTSVQPAFTGALDARTPPRFVDYDDVDDKEARDTDKVHPASPADGADAIEGEGEAQNEAQGEAEDERTRAANEPHEAASAVQDDE